MAKPLKRRDFVIFVLQNDYTTYKIYQLWSNYEDANQAPAKDFRFEWTLIEEYSDIEQQLEAMKRWDTKTFIGATTSLIYGGNYVVPDRLLAIIAKQWYNIK